MGTPGSTTKRLAVMETVREVLGIWEKARIPTIEERNIVRKLEGMVREWELLKKHEKNKTANQKTKESAFQEKIDFLFNIKHKEWNSLIKIPEDKAFLLDQETQRKGYMGLEDKEYTRAERKRLERTERDQSLREAEAQRQKISSESVVLISSSSSSDTSCPSSPKTSHRETQPDPDPCSSPGPSTASSARAKSIITPEVAAALDRTKNKR